MAGETTRSNRRSDAPLVSLVTPVYNALPHLRNYLASVRAQTWRPLQFIAVDDGSTDGSLECLRVARGELADAEIDMRVLRVSHGGQAAAVNAALALVEGELFTWCDADDALAPDSVAAKARYLLVRPELGMVRSDGFIASNGRARGVASMEDARTQSVFDALFHNATYCLAGAYMIRSRLLFECYPERRVPPSTEGQNLQLLLPPASRSDCGFVPDRLFYYFLREGGHSSRRRSYTQQLRRSENFARLRAELLPYCRCDREHYLRESARILQSEREALLRAAMIRAREEMKR